MGNAIIIFYQSICEKKNKEPKYIVTLLVGAITIALFFGYMNFLIYKQKQRYEEKEIPIHLDDKYYGSEKLIEVTSEEINKMKKESFVLYIDYDDEKDCATDPDMDAVTGYMKKYNISFLYTSYVEFQDTYLASIRYNPSILVVKKGEIIAYLEQPDSIYSVSDNPRTISEFEEWIEQYIYNTKS